MRAADVRDRVTGVIYADNRIRTGLFGDKVRDLLAAFATQAALAIEDARFSIGEATAAAITQMKNLMDNVFASITSASSRPTSPIGSRCLIGPLN